MSKMTKSFQDIQKKLSALPTVIQQRVVVGATRASAKVIADEAKQRVPVRSGLLKSTISIAKAKKKDTKDGHVKFYVIPKTKTTQKVNLISSLGDITKLKFKRVAYYAHFVEFGTVKMEAQPFLRPAFENSKTKSVQAFQNYARKRIPKEIKKLAKS